MSTRNPGYPTYTSAKLSTTGRDMLKSTELLIR